MKHLVFAIFPLLLVSLLFGSCGRSSVETQLDGLDSILNQPPMGPEPRCNYDSILLVLDSLLPEVIGDDALESHRNLLCAMTVDKAERPVLSDINIRPAFDYYREKTHDGTRGDSSLLHRFAQSCFYMGVYYFHCDSTARLEQMMQKSAEVSKSCGDHYTAYLALTYLSHQLMKADARESVVVAQEALSEFRLSRHTSIYNETKVLSNLGDCNLYNGDQTQALECYKKALQVCAENGDSLSGQSTLWGIAYYYYRTQDYDKALRCLREYAGGNSFAQNQQAALLAVNIYMKTDSLDRAKEFIQLFLPKVNALQKFYSGLTLQKIALHQHNQDEAVALIDTIRKYADEMRVDGMRERLGFYQYNMEKERAIVQLRLRSERQRNLFLLAGVGVLCLLGIIFLAIRHGRKRQQHLIAIEKMRRQMIGERETYKHKLSELQLQMKNEEIEQKDRKLTYLRHYIEKQSTTIEAFKSGTEGERISLSDDDWKSLEIALDDVYDGFVLKLKTSFPHMKEEMVRLCMLQKISLTNREMANIFFISPESVKKRKQRLKKEFFPSVPKDITFEEIIENVDFTR